MGNGKGVNQLYLKYATFKYRKSILSIFFISLKKYFFKKSVHFLLMIKTSCIDEDFLFKSSFKSFNDF